MIWVSRVVHRNRSPEGAQSIPGGEAKGNIHAANHPKIYVWRVTTVVFYD